MPLAPGSRLGNYEILDSLGEGGMGVVYRARDTRLGRDVALKLLSDAFAADEERRERFEREAKVLASLNHPAIATLHGFEEWDGKRYLVMELVPGETLAEMLARGPLSADEALRLARDVADALDYAHERGIVHRDLKPANVKLTPEGRVKVLDFGLAKAFAADGAEEDVSSSPTLSMRATRAGVILGTAAYMSPEQARGQPVDKRSDIFSFGAVLYELLSGRRAFEGDTASDVLASVIKLDPDWSRLPETLDPRIGSLVRRCLEKDPKRRRRDVGDIGNEIEEVLSSPRRAMVAPRSLSWRPVLLAALVSLGLGALFGALLRGPSRETRLATRFTVTPPSDERITGLGRRAVALSPDGRRLAFSATYRIYLRDLRDLESKPLPNTESARDLTFSPDGEWLAFWVSGGLKKIHVSGGSPLPLGSASNPHGVSWTWPDAIFVGQGPAGIARIPADGGEPEIVVAVEPGETAGFPELLPDGDSLVFTLFQGGAEGRIVLHSLRSGERRVLVERGADSCYVPTGHLVYALGNRLLAVPFDTRRLEVTGGAVPLVEGVSRSGANRGAQYSVAVAGSLAYLPVGVEESRLVWVDREDNETPLSARVAPYQAALLSPEGDRVALELESDLWLYDIARGTMGRLTFTADNAWSAWTPDGKEILFSSSRLGADAIFRKAADGSGEAELVTSSESARHPDAISLDGKHLVFHEHGPTGADIWVVDLGSDPASEPRPLLATPFDEVASAFAPDGTYLVYRSNVSGRHEIYVTPFPGPGPRIQVSNQGGVAALWSGTGGEIFYREDDRIMAVDITLGGAISLGTPRLLFERALAGPAARHTAFSPTRDGQRFLIAEAGSGLGAIDVVVDWFAELERVR